ncbi:MAG: 1-acyl-sn-glycerol-3-phosphate acyltransferase [Bacteroidia bacterium]
MKYILLPFRIIFKIYYFLFFILSIIISYPVMYFLLSKPKRFPTAFDAIRVHSFFLLLFAGVRLKVKGLDNIPKSGSYIICPNHSSYLDIMCLYSIFNNYFVFTGKKEIEKWPLFHIYYTSGMNILVNRDIVSGSLKAIKKMLFEIEKGNPIAIFPEGTISKTAPELGSFKSGAFAIAIQKQIPVIPITFITNWKLLFRSGFWKGPAGPGVAEVIIHKPIITSGLKKENITRIKNEVFNIINRPLLKN